MKSNLKSLIVGLALALAATPAIAGGDYDMGSVKDYAGVPVPAPIPIPLYDPVWYFRVDVNLGLSEAPSATEEGLEFGDGNRRYYADHNFEADDSWLYNQYEQNATYGLGVGYRWSSWLRADVTAETKREQKVRVVGHDTAGLIRNENFVGPMHVPGYYEADTDDHTIIRGGIVMFNAYYDFNKYGGFRPYIGAGLGLGITEIKRTNHTTETAIDRTPGDPNTEEIVDEETQVRHHETALAAAVMVGTTYQLSDITDLDFSYRYLWVDGFDSQFVANGHQSTISVDSMSEHNLRAGLRFNVN